VKRIKPSRAAYAKEWGWGTPLKKSYAARTNVYVNKNINFTTN
jgi:hypothetical protein